MRIKFLIFLAAIMMPAVVAADCDTRALTRCIDSACNDSAMGLGARCALCGTDAADWVKQGALKSLTLGRGGLTTLNIADAPSAPGARYAWAAGECMKKIDGCLPENITNIYDPLVTESCKFAAENIPVAAAAPVRVNCDAQLQNCITDACGADMAGCDFDLSWSSCVLTTKCNDAAPAVRSQMLALKSQYAESAAARFSTFIKSKQTARENMAADAVQSCGPEGKEKCVLGVCATLPGGENCTGKNRQIATDMCAYVDVACRGMNQ